MSAVDENARAGRRMPPDDVIVERLRSGDEAMFASLVDTWSRGMLRAARAYVANTQSAEDVVQDTWLAVLRGIDRFKGRSSLRTWVYRILVNTAKPRRRREPHDSGRRADPRGGWPDGRPGAFPRAR
jgi:RNA polymerase sigma-70 factor (ECF subfamily)